MRALETRPLQPRSPTSVVNECQSRAFLAGPGPWLTCNPHIPHTCHQSTHPPTPILPQIPECPLLLQLGRVCVRLVGYAAALAWELGPQGTPGKLHSGRSSSGFRFAKWVGWWRVDGGWMDGGSSMDGRAGRRSSHPAVDISATLNTPNTRTHGLEPRQRGLAAWPAAPSLHLLHFMH